VSRSVPANTWMASVALGIFFALVALRSVEAQSQFPAERYTFGPFFSDDYIDMFPGADMLPFTDDDFEVPERGNSGGSWSLAHFDVNSDGVIDEEERIFVIIRREDDGVQNFSIMNRPEYGVLYEAEDWVDYHEARNRGPSATLLGNLGAEGNDFEHNDRPPFESESNAYLYNNARANQHGKGKPRYYFEQINPEFAPAGEWVYEEPEGYRKPLSFQNNLDDPTTALNERGDCRNSYMRTYRAITRGYLIPVADLPALEDGSLDSLFGWEPEGFDLARYLRAVIAPRLEKNDIALYCDHATLCGGSYESSLPPTHLMLLQVESPIVINDNNACPNPATAQALADYWGLPPTGATYRVSHLLGFNADVHELGLGKTVRRWIDEPDDGAERNLWLLDHFFRRLDRTKALDRYERSGAPFDIVPDPGFGVIDDTANKVLVTNGPSSVRVPLPRPLTAGETPVELIVDLGVSGTDPDARHQIILEDAQGGVVAYAEIGEAGVSVNRGGVLADGFAGSPAGTVAGPPLILGEATNGEYTRIVLRLTESAVSLHQELHGDYVPNDFTGLEGYPTVASLAEAASGGAAAIRISTTGLGEPIGFSAVINAAQEVPPPVGVPAEAGGMGTFSYETATRELVYDIEFSGLSSPETAAHFHIGAPGVAGPVAIGLPAGSPKQGKATLTVEQETALFAGLFYVNIHTQMNGAGEIRGQLQPTPIGGSHLAVSTIALLAGFEPEEPPKPKGAGPFVRGDCNGDGQVSGQVTDAVFMLNFNFTGGARPPCMAACDANHDGQFTGQVTDAVYVLAFNFLGGPPPPAPFPQCGNSTDARDLALGCETPRPSCP
jgi:hypothetical protein